MWALLFCMLYNFFFIKNQAPIRRQKTFKITLLIGFQPPGTGFLKPGVFFRPDALYIASKAAQRAPKRPFLIFFLIFWPGPPKIQPFLAPIGYSLALLDIPEAESRPPLWFCIMIQAAPPKPFLFTLYCESSRRETCVFYGENTACPCRICGE